MQSNEIMKRRVDSPGTAIRGLARESLRQLRRGIAGMLAFPASAAIGFGAMLMTLSLAAEGTSALRSRSPGASDTQPANGQIRRVRPTEARHDVATT
jgi:hypothetical protein